MQGAQTWRVEMACAQAKALIGKGPLGPAPGICSTVRHRPRVSLFHIVFYDTNRCVIVT